MGGFILRLHTSTDHTVARAVCEYVTLSSVDISCGSFNRIWRQSARESRGHRGARRFVRARAGGQRLSAALSVWSVLLCGESVSATCDAPRVRVVTAHDTSRYSMPFGQKNRAEYMGAVARPRTALGRRWRWRQQRRRRRRRRVRTRARGGGGDGGRAAAGQEDQEGSEKLRRLLGLVRDGEARHCLSTQFSGRVVNTLCTQMEFLAFRSLGIAQNLASRARSIYISGFAAVEHLVVVTLSPPASSLQCLTLARRGRTTRRTNRLAKRRGGMATPRTVRCTSTSPVWCSQSLQGR